MNTTVVIPLSRPHRVPALRDTLELQTLKHFNVVVCENGPALGACKLHNWTTSIVTTSEPHQATAKNTAIEETKRKFGGRFVMVEDDDYYGPDYIQEVVANARKADVVGKIHHWVRFQDGLYLFNRHKANNYSKWLHGPTLSGLVEDAAEFPRVKPDDDQQWCKAMAAKGAVFWATSVGNYVYDRTGTDHVWSAPQWLVRRVAGQAIRFRPGYPPDIVKSPDDAQILREMQSLAFRTT